MADTTGVFTITNITLTRTLNLDAASLTDKANLIGTMIYDVQEELYDGTAYTLTGGSVDVAFDADATSLTEGLNVTSEAIGYNLGTIFWIFGFAPSNYTLTYTMDCTSTSQTEVADVLATALLYLRFPQVLIPCTVQFTVKAADTAVSGAVCTARLKGTNQAAHNTLLSNVELSDTTDANGEAELSLVPEHWFAKGNGIYRIEVKNDGKPLVNKEVAIPNQSTVQFEVLV